MTGERDGAVRVGHWISLPERIPSGGGHDRLAVMDKCPNCGAPLPEVERGTVVRCPFCGTETREGGDAPAPSPSPPREPTSLDPELQDLLGEPVRQLPPVSPVAPPTGLITALVGGVVILGGAVVLLLSLRGSGSHPAGSTSPSAASAREDSPPSVFTPATLASAKLNQWKSLPSTPLDAPGMTGDFANFDVVGNVGWASSIATTWSSDAKLWRLYVDGISPDGTIDLSRYHHADVILEFNSVSKGDVDLTIDFHIPRGTAGNSSDHVDVSVSSHMDSTARDPLPAPTCPISRVFQVLRSKSEVANINKNYAVALTLSLHGTKAYWNLTYAAGQTHPKTIEDWVDAATCAIAHPQ